MKPWEAWDARRLVQEALMIPDGRIAIDARIGADVESSPLDRLPLIGDVLDVTARASQISASLEKIDHFVSKMTAAFGQRLRAAERALYRDGYD